MDNDGKPFEVEQNGSFGTFVGTDTHLRAVECKGNGKVVVCGEGQPLLRGLVVKVAEVSADDEDETRLPAGVGPTERTEYGLTFGMMSLRLFFPFFIYCLAVGAVAAPKITIILAMMCRRASVSPRNGSIQNDDTCATPSVHAEMSRFMVYANLISGALCAVCGPQICRWSDRYGRRPFIAISVMGMLLGDLVSMLAASFPERIPVHWILFEFVFGGLTGAFLTTMALVQSYVADVTGQEQRTSAFGILHACMFLGLGFGPGIGAFYIRLAGGGDVLSVFYVAGACHLLFVLYILLLIPESLSAAVRREKQLTAMGVGSGDSTAATKGRIFNIFRPLQLFSRYGGGSTCHRVSILRTLAGIDMLAFGVQIGLPPLLVVYSQFRFEWKTVEASLFLSLTNTTRGFVLAVVLPFSMWLLKVNTVTKRQRVGVVRDDANASSVRIYLHTIRTAILLEILGQIGFAVSRSPTSFTLSGTVAAAAAPISPVTQSLMTFYVEPSRWGELFGAVSLLHSVARALIPALMQTVYGLTVRSHGTVIYWVLSVLFAGVFILSSCVSPREEHVQLQPSRVVV